MKVRIADQKEFCAGLIFAAIGLVALAVSCQYRLGSATRMGPGYFPLCLSITLTVLGLGAMLKGLRASTIEPIGRWPVVPGFFVLCGVVAFGVAIDVKGLAVAVLLLILLSCYARLRSRPLEVALIALSLVVFTIGVFIYGLGMPFFVYK